MAPIIRGMPNAQSPEIQKAFRRTVQIKGYRLHVVNSSCSAKMGFMVICPISHIGVPLTLSHRIPTLKTLSNTSMSLENIVGKGENAGKHHYFPFPTLFSTLLRKKKKSLQPHLICRLQMLSVWTSLKFYRLVKGLTLSQSKFSFWLFY